MRHPIRPRSVRYVLFAIISVLSLGLIAGCGGDKVAASRGEVSGLVTDENGLPVRSALVFFDGTGSSNDHETTTTTVGTYTLKDIPSEERLIQAEIVRNGIRYYGQNLATVDSIDRAKNVNIALFRDDQLAKLHGSVFDRRNNLLQGVRVFARPLDDPTTTSDDTLLTSTIAISDDKGEYVLAGLRAGLTYQIQVNALGYNSDFEQVNLTAGQDKPLNFIVADGAIVDVPKPTNVSAMTFTAPATPTKDPRAGAAYAMLKDRLRPSRPAAMTRSTILGNPIETDLFWDPIDNTALLGFSIWRGNTTTNLRNVGFARDPQAVYFADNDDSLVENLTYQYGVKSVDTLYDGIEGVSAISNIVEVQPLGDLLLGGTELGSKPKFRWTLVPRATRYSVFLYTEYPSIGVVEFYTNYASPVNGTEFVYPRTDLTSGRTYYFLVVAESADKNAVSFSRVGSFVQP